MGQMSHRQGRYTWRHNNIINYIINQIDTTKFKIYSDLEGHTTSTGGTIPANICPTTEKPDLVLIDEKTKTVHIFELTVPFEPNIEKRHNDKTDKYAHFLIDIPGNSEYKVEVSAFEIGSRGLVTMENSKTLKIIHNFTKKDTKFSKFRDNISALSVTGSYTLFLARKEPVWNENTPYLNPPVK